MKNTFPSFYLKNKKFDCSKQGPPGQGPVHERELHLLVLRKQPARALLQGVQVLQVNNSTLYSFSKLENFQIYFCFPINLRCKPDDHVVCGDIENQVRIKDYMLGIEHGSKISNSPTQNGSGGRSAFDEAPLFLAEQCPLKDHKVCIYIIILYRAVIRNFLPFLRV